MGGTQGFGAVRALADWGFRALGLGFLGFRAFSFWGCRAQGFRALRFSGFAALAFSDSEGDFWGLLGVYG